jgi:hypothetical protein
MSFVLGYVVNEGGILYMCKQFPHSSGRVGRLSRMDFEISGEAEQTRLVIDYSQSSKKNCSLRSYLGTEVGETF